jgi:2'-5' RNA ligase
MSDQKQWRLFCAIEIPSEVRQRVSAHAKQLRELVPNVRASWTREDNLHLTIKFIGEVDAYRALSLSEATERAVFGITSFSIVVENTGVFSKRVLWIGVSDPSGRLAVLQQRLEEECFSAGFPKDTRAFSPHLTLARFRQPFGTQALANAHKQMQLQPLPVQVNELLVIRSQLNSEGSKYTVVSRHAIG